MVPPPEPRKILCICEGQLGDLLILTPALRGMKESFPSSSLTVLLLQRRAYGAALQPAGDMPGVVASTGGTAEVLLNDPHVDAVFEIDRAQLRMTKGLSRLRAEARIIGWLRRERFDTVICTFPQDRFFAWAFFSGASVRVGEGGSPFLNRRIHRSKGEEGVLKYYCTLAEAAGATVSTFATRFVVPPGAEEMAAAQLTSMGLSDGGYVVVHPGASGNYRVWPPGSFAGVIDALQESEGKPVILCGSEFDREVLDAVSAACKTSVRTVVTSKGVGHLAALLKHAALALSNNSGPRHLAVAVGTPSLAVIPRFDDREWKIYTDESRCATVQSSEPCPACAAESCRNLIPEGERFGSYCMRAVPVEAVLRRIASILTPL